MTEIRPTWDEYFLGLLEAVAKRATCDRGRSGSLIVKDRQIVATGYVGSPPGHPHCDEEGHLFKQMLDEDGTVRTHCVRTIHAEQNAICQAARHGISVQGATLYCSMEPCRTCAMLIASVGIKRVVALRRYHAGQDSRAILANSQVELEVVHEEVTSYQQQAESKSSPNQG